MTDLRFAFRQLLKRPAGTAVILATLALVIVTTLGMREMLFGPRPFDFSTYGTVGIIMFASALLATLVPARRALRINPVEALRYE